MTLEQKNFILGFVEFSKINQDVEDYQDEIRNKIRDIVDALPNNKKIKGIELEGQIYNFLDFAKYKYFDLGVYAGQTLENTDLKWTPRRYKKDVRENDNK